MVGGYKESSGVIYELGLSLFDANRIARVLMVRQLSLTRKRALQEGAVVQQIVKGLLTLYARAGEDKRAVMAEDFPTRRVSMIRPACCRRQCCSELLWDARAKPSPCSSSVAIF
ncbi:MAG: hypothetical protein ACRD27_10790, partial [Terracidiphilus sp.]